MGKIVTAYNSGQCEVNAGHSWEAGNEIYWNKNENGVVIRCIKKACFEAQGGVCKETIKNEVNPQKPKPMTKIDKHTGQHVEDEIAQDDADLHGTGGPIAGDQDVDASTTTATTATTVKTMDVTDVATKMLKEKYVTQAKIIKIIQEALKEVFPNIKGEELGLKTKLLWEAEQGYGP